MRATIWTVSAEAELQDPETGLAFEKAERPVQKGISYHRAKAETEDPAVITSCLRREHLFDVEGLTEAERASLLGG